MKKFEDPIVEEVHQTRARLLEKHGGSEGYADHLREFEIELADRLVIHQPRTPIKTQRELRVDPSLATDPEVL
jgi:hypothetical protein